MIEKTKIMAVDHTEDPPLAVLLEVEVPAQASPHAMIREAVRRYALTLDGEAAYADANDHFNWGDFVNELGNPALKEIFKELGIRVEYLGSTDGYMAVDFHEPLMDDLTVTVKDIKWETDDLTLQEAGLPETVVLDDYAPNQEIADRLSDEYGFLVRSYGPVL